jgi:hypothetical protein
VKRAGLGIAFVLAAAAVARADTLTTVRRPVIVSEPVSGRVASIGGDVTIRSRVAGDVIVWGADVRIEPGGFVGGDVVDFGGSVAAPEGAIRGRLLTPGSLGALYLAEAERAPWARENAPWARGARRTVPWTTVAGLRLFVLAMWILLSSIVLRFRSGSVARMAKVFEESPGAAAASGVVGIVFLFLAGIAAFTALPAAARVPAAAAILAAAFALKLFGMTALFLFAGQKLTGRFSPASRPAALVLGLAVCGAVSLVPVAGPLLWSAASVFAVGAALYTRLGAPRFRVAEA